MLKAKHLLVALADPGVQASPAVARAAGVAIRVRCRWDYPIHEGIVREVVREHIDLLLIEGHRHGRVARLVLSNTDWQLMRLCPCPLLLVKSERALAHGCVLVSIDPTHAHDKPAELDKALLAAGADYTAAFGGKLHAAHFYSVVVPMAAGFMVEPLPLPPEVAVQHEREVGGAFIATVAHCNLGADCRHLRVGLPVDELPALAAELDAQLVVMGAVSRTGLKRLFIGHTAERVIDAISCDVRVLKQAGFRTAVPRRAVHRPVVVPPL